MTPAELTARCQHYAAECWFFAQSQDNAGDRLTLIDMAQTWLALADCVGKNECLFVVPDSKWRH
jgi:hypothetical protein